MSDISKLNQLRLAPVILLEGILSNIMSPLKILKKKTGYTKHPKAQFAGGSVSKPIAKSCC